MNHRSSFLIPLCFILTFVTFWSCTTNKGSANQETVPSQTEPTLTRTDSMQIARAYLRNKQPDTTLAAETGADAYGMKKYVMAFLSKGPNRDLDSAKAAELQAAHMNNINRMAEEGKLVLAGPFFGDGDLRGIYIFNVENLEEAEALTNSDPAIQAGSLKMELKEWYGSAALMLGPELYFKVAKNPV